MIAGLLLAHIIAAPVAASDLIVPQVTPKVALQRYAAAVRKIKEPRVMTFDYTLDQSGMRTLAQTHRVFRSGNDERDETLTVDGKRLSPPKVRVFRSRRNRYTIGSLAPRPADYDFTFVGPRRNAHHVDYVFRLTPKAPRAFAITDMTIDGVRFLPASIDFATGPNDGSGSITFGRNAVWWVPYIASARATVGDSTSTERLAFYSYRFPPSLPLSTFSQGRRLPLPGPAVHGAPAGTRPASLDPASARPKT